MIAVSVVAYNFGYYNNTVIIIIIAGYFHGVQFYREVILFSTTKIGLLEIFLLYYDLFSCPVVNTLHFYWREKIPRLSKAISLALKVF